MKMNTSTKVRSANFTKREEKILLRLVKKYKSTLENPKCDSQTNHQKNSCWKLVENEFNLESSDVFRDDKTLRRKYDNLKSKIKRKIRSRAKTNVEPQNAEIDLKLKDLVDQRLDKLASASEVEYSDVSCSDDSDTDTQSNIEVKTPNTPLNNNLENSMENLRYYPNVEIKEEIQEVNPFQEERNGCYQSATIELNKKKVSKFRRRLEDEEHKLRMQLTRRKHEVEIELMRKESEAKISGVELQAKATLHYIKNEHILKMEILELEKKNLLKKLDETQS